MTKHFYSVKKLPIFLAISAVILIAGIVLFLWGISSYAETNLPLWVGLFLLPLTVIVIKLPELY